MTCATIGCHRTATKRRRQLCAACEVRIRARASRHCAEDVPNPGGPGSRGGRQHGTHAGYTAGCRCQPCTEANTQASRDYHATLRRLGRTQPGFADPHATRALVETLRANGHSINTIARGTGLAASTLHRVLRVDGQPTRRTYQALRRLIQHDTADQREAA